MALSWKNVGDESTAPVAEAVSTMLAEILGSGQVSCRGSVPPTPVRVFSYREDFDYLWSFDDSLLNSLGSSCHTVVLIWDGTPADKDPATEVIRIGDHVTAFDWAVALGCK